MAYVIGVDCGTSGTKTVLFDEKGSVIASKTIEYPMYQPKNGYAEQEPADWANAMIETVKAVLLCLTRTTTYFAVPLSGAIREQLPRSRK